MSRTPPPPPPIPVRAFDIDSESKQDAPPPVPPRKRSIDSSQSSITTASTITTGKKNYKPVERDIAAEIPQEVVVPEEKKKPVKVFDDSARFNGKKLVQFGLWAHYMSYGAAWLCFFLGTFAILWMNPIEPYNCQVDGRPINAKYYNQTVIKATGLNGNCTNHIVLAHNGRHKLLCCNVNRQSAYPNLVGSNSVGAVYIIYSIVIVFLENTEWGYGLYYPIDTFFYKYRISPWSFVSLGIGLYGLTIPVTALAGAALVILAGVQAYTAFRQEAGDGGRNQRRQQLAKSGGKKSMFLGLSGVVETLNSVFAFRPYHFYMRIKNEDKLSSYFWLFVFLSANLIYFVITLLQWYVVIGTTRGQLLDGTLALTGFTRTSHMNRQSVKYGPPTYYAAWAKAFGTTLNMDCALLILPVTKLLLSRLNNIGVSFSKTRNENDYFAKFFASPFTRYVPLSKNIAFHKVCAVTIFFLVCGHIIMHYSNLAYSNRATQALFRDYLNASFPTLNWSGAAFFTGSVITLSMFLIYSAANDDIRMARYEIFFVNHHFFTVFYLFLMVHGPNTFFWTFVPVGLYLYERYLQTKRGNHGFLLCKVEYIPPVMAVYFRPVNKKHFQFQEGQYLYLNCPAVSKNEWHPFTISSALDDLNFGPRVDILTGEEVMEVPRPTNLPPNIKWRKYCHITDDWKHMNPNDFLDKGDVDYLDFVSVHIKVHGQEDKTAKTWTRKLKEYFELLQGDAPGSSKFPMYFSQRDMRGEVTIGKRYGPDGLPILRVDGPHSAPAEHYTAYSTLMIIGAGIGLTPCASILCALTKYRWKKNFNPELLHFYWIVRQSEVESFQWLVHMLTEICFELKMGREINQIESKYYCEMNIYVTGVEKNPIPVGEMHVASRPLAHEAKMKGLNGPAFEAKDLYAMMMNPTVESKGQVEKMSQPNPPNKMGDIWIWNGRPMWDEVFREMRDQRQHKDIGVCFCGAPVIGADLKAMCEKYTDVKEEVVFNLHKENF